MKSISLFNHQDLIRLGFGFPNPNHEIAFLEYVNDEYIKRINSILARQLSTEEISELSQVSYPMIREYILSKKPECIVSIERIKNSIEDELSQKRKNILTDGDGTFAFRK